MKKTRKLSVKKETLRNLNAPALGKVNGGTLVNLNFGPGGSLRCFAAQGDAIFGTESTYPHPENQAGGR